MYPELIEWATAYMSMTMTQWSAIASRNIIVMLTLFKNGERP